MSQDVDLPNGWIEVGFGELFVRPNDDVVDGPFGSNLKASEYVSAGIPIARLQNIDRNRFVAKNIQFVTLEKADELERHTFMPNDILITKLGDPLGKACLAPSNMKRGVLVADVVRARVTHPWVDKNFLCYQINSDSVVEQFKEQTKGTTRPRVNLTKIRALRMRLAPRAEQERIVAKLEELLSDLEAGIAELKAAQKKLQQYRQSLLKAAVEGVLTAPWREAQRKLTSHAETGAQLLQRILTERRARWEAKQLAKFKEQGKAPPKDWQEKYPEPVQPDTADLPALPEGWVWASVDQLGEIQGGIQKQPSRAPVKNKFPFLRVANVARGELRLSDVHEIELFAGELSRLRLETGDVLIVEGNGSLTEIGRCAIWDGSIPDAVHQNHLIRVRPLLLSGKWVETWLNSPFGISKLTKLAATTSGLYTLSVSKIARIPVPLPTRHEQSSALQSLDEAQADNFAQSKTIELALKQSAAQRQNILRAAFAGKLVPQDPIDEPASVLLERIRAEAAERAKQPKTRKTKQKKEIAAVVSQLIDVLVEAGDWVPAQEAFRRCGVTDGSTTDQIEALYAELRALEKAERLVVEPVADAQGRKLYDKLKLSAG
ncbi:TPA: hypothetical protein QDB19_003545 [Burkholderia vietnamiensis]|nr:hypothetical protein [Burkholderia vietnamiensis]